MTTALDTKTAAMLQKIARSPMFADIERQAAAERAASRRTIIAAMLQGEAAAQREAQELGRQAAAELREVERLRGELAAAAGREFDLRRRASLASMHAEYIRDAARKRLGEFGGAVIHETLERVLWQLRVTRNGIVFNAPLHQLGDLRPMGTPTLATPHLLPRVAELERLAAELQAMTFDAEKTPGEIEQRCKEIAAELEKPG